MTKGARAEIGRQKRLKISRGATPRAGSSPAARTIKYETCIWCELCGDYDYTGCTIDEHMKLHRRVKNTIVSSVIYKKDKRCKS